MTLALSCLMAYELIGQDTHEVMGICMVSAFILHHILNSGWHTHLFKGKYTAYLTVLTVLDILMAVIFVSQAVSGIMMAKHVFPSLPHVGRRSFARILHLLGAYWGFTLCSLHAGMHMTGLVWKWQKKNGAVRIIPAALAGLASTYGLYAFIRRGFPTYMTLRESFVFFNYEEPLVLFFLDYAAILVLFMTLGTMLGCLLQRRKRT